MSTYIPSSDKTIKDIFEFKINELIAKEDKELSHYERKIPFILSALLVSPFLIKSFGFMSGLLITLMIPIIFYSLTKIFLADVLSFFVFNVFSRKHKSLKKYTKHIAVIFPLLSTPFSILKLNKKYNLLKIKKALDSHDFQSPDLSLFIKDNFTCKQDDLEVLSDDEMSNLYQKLLENKNVCEEFIGCIEKSIPIRKMNVSYFLDKIKLLSPDINLENKNLENIVRDFREKEIASFKDSFKDSQKIKIPTHIFADKDII